MESNTQKLIHSFGALADLGQEIADSGDFMEMVRTSLHLLLGTLAIRRGAVLECPSHLETTNCLATWGLSDDYGVQCQVDSKTKEAILQSEGLIAADDSDVASALAELRTQEIELLVPMIVRGKVTGLVALGGKASGEAFTTDDLEVVSAMVRHIGVGIHTHRLLAEVKQQSEENRRLYFDLRAIYRDTVRAFAAAIDIKDKYTQGHSERVGRYSEIIARELGWGEEEVEGMAIAGYLHDVGKLVVERDIINAPYKIDAKQSSELNRHPRAGFDILSPIHHPFADIPLMAKYHHERLDGRGYPDGLIDEEIPVGAKIVSLADSFDAMTTDRPYRKKLPLTDVLEDFRQNTGTQFDPAVVCAFCRAFLNEIEGKKERRLLNLLNRNYDDLEGVTPILNQMLTEFDGAALAAASN